MAGTKKWLLWGVVAVVGSCSLCGLGTMAVMALGLMPDDGDKGSHTVAAARQEGQPGAPGGFAFEPPKGWTSPGPGRFLGELKQGSELMNVEVIHLAAIPGLEGAEAKLAQLWTQSVSADWEGITGAPLVLRRFVANGARAYFTSAELHPKKGGTVARVSLYLVEAGDRLEPLVIIQTHSDPTNFASSRDMFARSSWEQTHPLVEAALAGTRGSPVGLLIVEEQDVVGHFAYGTNSTAQWVNTMTGSTSMTSVAYSVRFTFDEDHRFSYKFQSASGQIGAQQFGFDKDEGEWKIEHDVLVLTSDSGKQRKYLIAGAAPTPDGKRALYLLPEHPSWSLSPGNIGQHGELYVAE